MRDGRIQQVGIPEEIYFSPVNSFIAGFVGSPSISFIDSEIANGRLIFGQFSVMIEGYGAFNRKKC
jgi:ABC-type sugar transport system ATPase subunit